MHCSIHLARYLGGTLISRLPWAYGWRLLVDDDQPAFGVLLDRFSISLQSGRPNWSGLIDESFRCAVDSRFPQNAVWSGFPCILIDLLNERCSDWERFWHWLFGIGRIWTWIGFPFVIRRWIGPWFDFFRNSFAARCGIPISVSWSYEGKRSICPCCEGDYLGGFLFHFQVETLMLACPILNFADSMAFFADSLGGSTTPTLSFPVLSSGSIAQSAIVLYHYGERNFKPSQQLRTFGWRVYRRSILETHRPRWSETANWRLRWFIYMIAPVFRFVSFRLDADAGQSLCTTRSPRLLQVPTDCVFESIMIAVEFAPGLIVFLRSYIRNPPTWLKKVSLCLLLVRDASQLLPDGPICSQGTCSCVFNRKSSWLSVQDSKFWVKTALLASGSINDRESGTFEKQSFSVTPKAILSRLIPLS